MGLANQKGPFIKYSFFSSSPRKVAHSAATFSGEPPTTAGGGRLPPAADEDVANTASFLFPPFYPIRRGGDLPRGDDGRQIRTSVGGDWTACSSFPARIPAAGNGKRRSKSGGGDIVEGGCHSGSSMSNLVLVFGFFLFLGDKCWRFRSCCQFVSFSVWSPILPMHVF